MAYADGFLIPVPTANLAAYRKMSEKAGKVWMEHGALDYKECVGDDLAPQGINVSFPKLLKLKPGHSVVFSWIVYASKAERNRILKQVMADPRIANMPDPCPFDPKLMSYAGFEVVVDMAKPAKRGAAKRAPLKKSTRKQAKRPR